jgi:hypothetical protein
MAGLIEKVLQNIRPTAESAVRRPGEVKQAETLVD